VSAFKGIRLLLLFIILTGKVYAVDFRELFVPILEFKYEHGCSLTATSDYEAVLPGQPIAFHIFHGLKQQHSVF